MRILLVDDHPLFLEGLKNLLTIHGMDVVGTACNGLDGLEKARVLNPEVIFMDIQMPRLNGLEATRLIKAEMPDVKIVMLTYSENDEDLFEAIKSGAYGYLLKADETDRFFDLLSGLMRGEVPLSPSLAGRVLKEYTRQTNTTRSVDQQDVQEEVLTPRQIEVLTLLAEGLIYKEIGARLFISERTIKYHIGEIIQRLHLENRRQVIEYARRMNLGKK